MKATDFIPSRETLAQAIGLERPRITSDPVSVLMIFAAGALTGGALALLFASSADGGIDALRRAASRMRGRKGSQMPGEETPVLREM